MPPARTGTRSPCRGVRGEQARAALRDEVVGGQPGERPVRAERGDDPDDERRVGRVQLVPGEAEGLRPRRRRVVDHDVRGRDELAPARPALPVDLRSSTTDRLPRFSGTKYRPNPGATGITCRYASPPAARP